MGDSFTRPFKKNICVLGLGSSADQAYSRHHHLQCRRQFLREGRSLASSARVACRGGRHQGATKRGQLQRWNLGRSFRQNAPNRAIMFSSVFPFYRLIGPNVGLIGRRGRNTEASVHARKGRTGDWPYTCCRRWWLPSLPQTSSLRPFWEHR